MKNASFRPSALRDIRETAVYLAINASEEIAERFQDAVQSLIHTLVRAPGIGSPCSFRNPQLAGLRYLTITGFENWLVFYQITKERIDVIRVLHGARDIAAIFEEDA